jgi:hypothetical protein
MLQRALQVTPPHLAPKMFCARRPLDARALFRSWADRCLLTLRQLVEFAAAGGPMS